MRVEDDEVFITSQDADIRNFNFHILKADNDLFNEDDDVPATVISAKRIRQPKNNEDWAILENGKIVLRMKGTRFTKKEKNFLRTPEGMSFLIAEYKGGVRSVVKFKNQMKSLL